MGCGELDDGRHMEHRNVECMLDKVKSLEDSKNRTVLNLGLLQVLEFLGPSP